MIVGTAAMRVATSASAAVNCAASPLEVFGADLATQTLESAAQPGGVADRQTVEAGAQFAHFVARGFGHSGKDRRSGRGAVQTDCWKMACGERVRTYSTAVAMTTSISASVVARVMTVDPGTAAPALIPPPW